MTPLINRQISTIYLNINISYIIFDPLLYLLILRDILILKQIEYLCLVSQLFQTKVKQLKLMKHSQFKIRSNGGNNYNSRAKQQIKLGPLFAAANKECLPSSSSLTYEDGLQSSSNDPLMNIFKNLTTTLQQLMKSHLNRRNDLQVRDRSYLLQIPNATTFRKNKQILKKWVQKMISDIVSISFNYFSNDQFTYEQAKIYCSQNILSNLAALVNKCKLTSVQLKEIDEFIRDDILQLLSKKYPMTQSIVVNRSLEAIAKAPDLSDKLENDFFTINKVLFEANEKNNFSKQIKLTVNTIINQINEKNALIQQSSNFEVFQKLMAKVFEIVEDKDWMISNQAQRSDAILSFLYGLQQKQVENSSMKAKQSFFSIQSDSSKRQYKEKVKEYTSYLIGRKISENVPHFTEQQINIPQIQIKSTAILRILTKWCQQLWQKFIPRNYYVNQTEDFRLLNGEVKSVSQQMRSNLDKLMQAEKAQIKLFMAKVTNDNYEAQINLLNQLLENSQDEFWQKNLQKIGEKFSVLIGKTLEKQVIKYLNRLMQGLTNVSNIFYKKYFSNQWSSPPNLVTFKIGDLMRCKCSSGQRQIRYIFQLIKWLSDNRPQILQITRIKNRLRLGTNDILMNVKFCGSSICEIQLAVNSKKSKFIKSSNVMSHYLYQIQRSLFGPINQLGSIWRNLDLRASYFDKNVGGGKITGSHRCQALKKSYQFQSFDAPFICSICNNTYSQNTMIIKHVKCSQCSFWKCAHCQIKQMPSQKLTSMFIHDAELRKICEKKVILDEQNKQLPTFGISVHLNPQKKSQVLIFKRLQIRGVNYLFARQSGKLKLLLKITQDGVELQYLKQHLVFEVNSQNGSNLMQLTVEQANAQYFLPFHISECYKNHKNAITLENQPIDSNNCRSIFKGSQQDQMNVTSLSLANTNLKTISPLDELFPNLRQLTLNENKNLVEFDNIPLFINLRQLTLRNITSLYQIPQEFFKLQQMVRLDLKNCIFSELPQQIGELKNLKFLDLSHSEGEWRRFIRVLPKSIYTLTQLQELNLSFQSIFQLDEDIGKLKKLKYLNIKRNGISQLPSAINQLPHLQFFDFRENPLKTLPNSFSGLRKLKQFRLQDIGEDATRIFNEIIYRSSFQQLPQDLQQIQNLKIIKIHSENLKQLPPLEKCKNLQEINLFRSALNKVPRLKNCQSLVRMNLRQQMKYDENEELACLSDDIFKQTPNLAYFCASYNPLRKIPKSISFLANLIQLDLRKCQLQEICEEIGGCRSLLKLNLWCNKIKKLPNSIKHLQKMQYLELSDNQLTELNEGLSECTGLHELIINSNKITALPQSIGNLINLQIFSLRDNLIGILPKSLNNLKKIKSQMFKVSSNPVFMVECADFIQRSGDQLSKNILKWTASGCFYANLSNGKLQKISTSIKRATNLNQIICNSNDLEELPDQISALTNLANVQFTNNKFQLFPLPLTLCTNLKSINFDNNQIAALPIQIGRLTNLQKLILTSNQICQISSGINSCQNLLELDLSENKLITIANEIFIGLVNLKSISFYGNSLTEFPSGLLKCSKLQKLNLGYNQITSISGSFKDMSKLLQLTLQHNLLAKFPQSILQCQNLSELILDSNKIEAIPDSLYKLKNLKQLSICYNCLRKIPQSIGKATSLTDLNLAKNQIEVVIKELDKLENMQRINLYNNPINKIQCRDWIMKKGTQETIVIAESIRK